MFQKNEVLRCLFFRHGKNRDRNQNLPHYAVFNLIRADYGQEKVVESRKLAKLTLKIDKAYLDLKFNHICKTEELTPNSLKFSPPVRDAMIQFTLRNFLISSVKSVLLQERNYFKYSITITS